MGWLGEKTQAYTHTHTPRGRERSIQIHAS